MEREGFEGFEDRSEEPDSGAVKGPISKALLEAGLVTIDEYKARELGLLEEPPAKQARAGTPSTTGHQHLVNICASYASKCCGRLRMFSGLNNFSYIDWEDHFPQCHGSIRSASTVLGKNDSHFSRRNYHEDMEDTCLKQAAFIFPCVV